jgi:hypothetical protein
MPLPKFTESLPESRSIPGALTTGNNRGEDLIHRWVSHLKEKVGGHIDQPRLALALFVHGADAALTPL